MNSTGDRRRRTLLVAATVLMSLLMAAPVAGASTTTTTTPSPASSCGIAASDAVRVVSADYPCIVATPVGGSFEILLRSGWRWGTPVSSSKSVIVSQITKTSMGVASAVLTATSAGVATIDVTGTIYCAKGKVCPDLAMLWTLTVMVTKGASAPLTLRLTSGDTNNSYRLRSGDRVLVSLAAVAKYTWSEPTVTSSSVLRRVSGRAGASASALFIARSSGRARIVATQTCGANCTLRKLRFSVSAAVTSKS